MYKLILINKGKESKFALLLPYKLYTQVTNVWSLEVSLSRIIKLIKKRRNDKVTIPLFYNL